MTEMPDWADLLKAIPRDDAGHVRAVEPPTLPDPAPGDIQRNKHGQWFRANKDCFWERVRDRTSQEYHDQLMERATPAPGFGDHRMKEGKIEMFDGLVWRLSSQYGG